MLRKSSSKKGKSYWVPSSSFSQKECQGDLFFHLNLYFLIRETAAQGQETQRDIFNGPTFANFLRAPSHTLIYKTTMKERKTFEFAGFHLMTFPKNPLKHTKDSSAKNEYREKSTSELIHFSKNRINLKQTLRSFFLLL